MILRIKLVGEGRELMFYFAKKYFEFLMHWFVSGCCIVSTFKIIIHILYSDIFVFKPFL